MSAHCAPALPPPPPTARPPDRPTARRRHARRRAPAAPTPRPSPYPTQSAGQTLCCRRHTHCRPHRQHGTAAAWHGSRLARQCSAADECAEADPAGASASVAAVTRRGCDALWWRAVRRVPRAFAPTAHKTPTQRFVLIAVAALLSPGLGLKTRVPLPHLPEYLDYRSLYYPDSEVRCDGRPKDEARSSRTDLPRRPPTHRPPSPGAPALPPSCPMPP